ncbi:hypothetical protein ACFOHU_13550 [Ottowia pentelensis]|uniref:Cell surface protein n=1 Tax=Ottowia pentelensis TaxID=511108 RepID=A0ABV6PR30_9BURK
MKKSILALGAAVALGGLGFAGVAQAGYYFGAGTTPPTGVDVAYAPGSVGHYLFTPYYSVQNGNGTIINITNTDANNGKAVKVRFRGAANSDDVFDFTVLLSPGDVWTGDIRRDGDSAPYIITQDKSCTLPQIPASGAMPGLNVFNEQNLDPALSAAGKLNGMSEGYIEYFNMADIPPKLVSDGLAGTINDGVKAGGANGVYAAIKHKSGVPTCATASLSHLWDTSAWTAAQAEGAGLAAPTGGLMGGWGVFNRAELAVFSGNHTAVRVNTATNLNGSGHIAFSPQIDTPTGTSVNAWTADPLLRNDPTAGSLFNTAYKAPLWFDLPDMSTPLVPAYAGDPKLQASQLSWAITHQVVFNDYVADPTGAVPATTDWVISQPTRRYHSAVAYELTVGGVTAPAIVANDDMANPSTLILSGVGPLTLANNRYAGLFLKKLGADKGAQSCFNRSISTTDREEFQVAAGGPVASPGTAPQKDLACGEVFTLTMGTGSTSVLGATITNSTVATNGTQGWASLNTDFNSPVVGYSATSLKASTGNFGVTTPHRSND